MDNEKYLGDFKAELNKYTEKLSKLGESFKEASTDETENISSSLGNILQEAKEAYEKLAKASAEEWEPLKEIAGKNLEHLKKSFDESLNTCSAKVKEYVQQCEVCSQEKIELLAEYIKHNPLKSTLLALALGIIVGKALK